MHIHDDNNNNREKRGEKREKAWFYKHWVTKRKKENKKTYSFTYVHHMAMEKKYSRPMT